MRMRRALSPYLLACAAALLLSAADLPLSVSALAAQPAATSPGARPAAAPAPAVAPPASTAAKPPAAAPTGVVPGETVIKPDQQTMAQRDAESQAAAEKLRKMTPKERQEFFEKIRAYYASLSPQQRKELNEKMKRQNAEYIAAHKAEWAKSTAEQNALRDKYTREFLEKMPAVERAVLQKYKELRKTHSKDYAWHMIIEDAGKGGKITPLPE